MARTAAILPPENNRAPFVAQGTLCLMAAACVAGIAFGLLTRKRGAAQATGDAEMARAEAEMLSRMALKSPGTAAPPQMLTPQIPQPSFSSIPAPSLAPQPPIATSPSPPRSSAPAKPSAPKPSLPLDKQLKNPQAMEAVMAARAMRGQGDMQAAIESLKSADLREPNHPEILGEMALTFEEMGIASRAEPLWRQIYTMGEATAGGYYTLASSKIGIRDANAAPADAVAGGSPVSLGACQMTREPIAKQGERITLRVPILATPGATIDPTKIAIHVTLYESVNGGARIETVPQDKTAQSWTTSPVNWREPSGETVDVTYDLQTQKQGSPDTRTFYGYVVELFYQNKLAGDQAKPDSLRGTAQKKPTSAGPDNALFPK